MFVRVRRTFSYDQENGTRRTIPAGWSGNLEDSVAQQAVDGGYTSEPESEAPASRTGQTVDDATAATATAPTGEADYDSMTRDELDAVARDRGMTPSDYRTKDDLIRALR